MPKPMLELVPRDVEPFLGGVGVKVCGTRVSPGGIPTPTHEQMSSSMTDPESIDFSVHPVTPNGPSKSDGGFFWRYFNVSDPSFHGASISNSSNHSASNFQRSVPFYDENSVNHNIDFSTIRGLSYIASGEYGNVFRGKWEGKNVAVKILKDEHLDSGHHRSVMEFEKKILCLCKPCPYIVDIYGSGHHGEKNHPFIVLEDLVGGTLDDFLSSRVKSIKNSVEVLLQIAKAIEFIHCNSLPGYVVMHRDVKPKNIAFDANNVAKLLDFGLSRVIETRLKTDVPDSPHMVVGKKCELRREKVKQYLEIINEDKFEMTGETGSLRYMAPEICRSSSYNHKSDCYSFSVLAWQVLTRTLPYKGMGVEKFKKMVVDNGYRLPIPKCWSSALKSAVAKGWCDNVDDRSNIDELVRELQEILHDLEVEKVSPCNCSIL